MNLEKVYQKTGSVCLFAQPGTVKLKDYILKKFTGSTNMGVFNCRDVRGGDTLSLHAEGRAVDIGGKPEVMQKVADWAVSHSGYWGIQEVIYNRKIWSASKANEGWRNYSGVNPHVDHVHIGQNWNGANPTYAKNNLDLPVKKLPLSAENFQLASINWFIAVPILVGGLGMIYQKYVKKN